jgi:16S rRNA (adenine1518-N6/adenine1519-N6)-dimethyltransferase
MSIAHPRTLLPFLKQIGAVPRRGLSQNFLIDANILRKIVKVANLCPADCVLEIGPGPGALTQELLKTEARVIAIEKDPAFAQSLCRLESGSRLQIIQADFLKFRLESLGEPALKVVANLPYHITTPILHRLCQDSRFLSKAWIMVQKEVALRMVAVPKARQMNSLAIFLQTYCHPKIVLSVSRRCFYPAPKVDSCVVELNFFPPPIKDLEKFHAFVRRAFQQRRKTLRSTLSIHREPYSLMRPEELSFNEWKELFTSKDCDTSQLNKTIESPQPDPSLSKVASAEYGRSRQ